MGCEPSGHLGRSYLRYGMNREGGPGGVELELRHLRALVAIAEAESISRAATQLRVPQPSLTAQLRRIEDTVGGKLFDRTPKGVQETALGRYMVGRARGVLAAAAHLGAGPLPSVTGG